MKLFKKSFISYGVISHDYSNNEPDRLIKEFKHIIDAIEYCEKLDKNTLFNIEYDVIKDNNYILHYVKPLTCGFLTHLINNYDKYINFLSLHKEVINAKTK